MLRRQKVEEIAPDEAQRRAADGAVLLDVREPEEWKAGHAPEALHVPLGQLSESAGELSGRPVLAICRSGRRSMSAAEALIQAGFDAVNVAGGMQAWAEAGLPVVRDDGSAGTVA